MIKKITKKQSFIAAGVLLFTVLAAVLLINAFKQKEALPEGYYAFAQNKWPSTAHTEGFPAFEGDIYSVLANSSGTAVFIQGADRASVDEYASRLSQSGLVFSADSYPKTAENEILFVTLA